MPGSVPWNEWCFKRGEMRALDSVIQALIMTVCSDPAMVEKFSACFAISQGGMDRTGVGQGSIAAMLVDHAKQVASGRDEAEGYAQMMRHASRGTGFATGDGAAKVREQMEAISDYIKVEIEDSPR